MKKKFFIMGAILFCGIMFLTGCSNGKLQNINYNDLEKKVNNKETFILEVIQTGCSACENFTPRFKKIIEENNITAYSLNLTNLSDDEKAKLNNLVNVSNTPTVVFFNKGSEESVMYRIVGAVDNDKIIQKLKAQDYIK